MSNAFKKKINSQIIKDETADKVYKCHSWSPDFLEIFSWIIIFILSIAFLISIVYNVPGVCLFQINIPIWYILIILMIIPSSIAFLHFTAPTPPVVGLIILIGLLTGIGWMMRGFGKLFELLH